MKMRLSLIGMMVLVASLCACSDDSGGSMPSGRQSSLTVSGVTLGRDGQLAATVNVVVKDESGHPMEGVELLLETSRPEDDEVIEGASGRTDATGGAVFHLQTRKIGTSDVKVTIVGRDVILGPVTVDFGLDVALYVSRPLLTDPGVHMDGRVVISDSQGPLEGLSVVVETSDQDVTVSQSQTVTDAQGNLEFSLESAQAATTDLRVLVSGLEGAIPAGTVGLHGPTVAGHISRVDGPGDVEALRVGLLFVDLRRWNDSGFVGTPQEIVSQQVTLDASGSADYELELPVRVPPEHIITTREGMDFAGYLVALYDDIGLLPGVMDEGDLLVGLNWSLPDIVFLGGRLLDGRGYIPGYNMIFFLQQQDLVAADPWDDWSSSMDVPLDRGTVHQVRIQGRVDCSNAGCDGDDWIVAAVMFDLTVPEHSSWLDGNYELLDAVSLNLSNGVALPFSLSLPELTSNSHYDSWSAQLLPTLVGNGFALLAFRDDNGNGKPDPYQGEPIVLPKQPWGAMGPLGWYVHPGFDWGLPLQWPGLHAGYALFLLPLELTIQEVDPSGHRLVVDQPVEAGHSGYRFRVLRDNGQVRTEVLSGSDLSTGNGGNDVTTAQDVGGVQPGDILQVTEIVQDMKFVGYSDVELSVP